MIAEGAFVTVHLIQPKALFWGRLNRLDQAGAVVRGIDAKLVDAFKFQNRRSEQEVFPQTLFFPMHRIEQISLDEAMGSLPSIIDDVAAYVGLDPGEMLV